MKANAKLVKSTAGQVTEEHRKRFTLREKSVLSTNELIPKQLDILRTFEKISQDLRTLHLESGEFDEIMHLVKAATNADEVALYMRKYASPDDYAFERLGCTPPGCQAAAFSEKYTQESATIDLWDILNTEKHELFRHVYAQGREISNLYACPLSLESDPGG